ncbi:hypothetical protein [Neorhizobium sp. DT-125]|uniref:hypothetical protein n=1 Tax=Neorhizobium sp. DT-125 TaxID=3396163 RepID=UPI003F1BC54F
MPNIHSPRHSVFDEERAKECEAEFRRVLELVISRAVAAGWREKEVALQIADLAEDYVMDLAFNSKASAANDN